MVNIQEFGAETLTRVRRGWDRTLAGSRPYRFDGEQATHADQLRETETSLSLMATASPDDPDQLRMASDIEHGAENRLAVLLGKPRLTLEEKRERDSIQAALAARRRGYEPAPVLVPRERPAFAPLGLLGASPVAGLLMSPVVWVAAAFAIPAAFGAVQTARLNHAKADLEETREDLALAQEQREAWRERAEQYAAAVTDARATAEQTAQALNQERRRQAAAARRERERQRAIQDILSGSPEPPAWRLRDDEPVSERPGSDD